VGHADRVERIFRLAKKYEGLFFCNNAYTGVGVNDCTKSAEETAKEILNG
jgi:oxygen-dependent protoporphyrinogen oxidase